MAIRKSSIGAIAKRKLLSAFFLHLRRVLENIAVIFPLIFLQVFF